MVIDFGDLKSIINEVIMDKYDHAFIAKGSERALKFVMASEYRYHIIGKRTTVENMAPIIHNELQTALESNFPKYKCYVSKVKLWETPTSFAEYNYTK